MSTFFSNDKEPVSYSCIVNDKGDAGVFDGEYVVFKYKFENNKYINKMLLKDFCNRWAYLDDVSEQIKKLQKYKIALQFYAEAKHLTADSSWMCGKKLYACSSIGIAFQDNEGNQNNFEIETGAIARAALE